MSKSPKLKIEMLSVDALQEYEGNARQHGDTDIAAIKESIEMFGFNDPIGIWGENVIVEGHGRLIAAKELGMTEVPCIRLDHMTDEERRAYALAHNKTAELSKWNFPQLDVELLGIHELDMSKLGFDVPVFEPEAADDEYDFDKEIEEGRVQRGQVWILGNHRLMCGDSSDEEDMAVLMGGVEPKMVFTDPPYGIAIGDKNKFLDKVTGESGRCKTNIIGDTLSVNELYEMLVRAFSLLKSYCAEDCSYYVTSPQGGELGLMMMMMRDAGLEVKHNLIWEKSSATFSMGRLDYEYKHEPIFYTWTKKHNFYGRGDCKNTVWQFPKPRKCDLHPTMKPVELVAECLKNNSQKGDPVADIFGGSGTTLIACEQLERSCLMMELDPHYCAVILDRWETFTGQRAQRIR